MSPCENPQCHREVERLVATTVNENSFRLCVTCYGYARKAHVLRDAEMVHKAERMKAQRLRKDLHCHNDNCRTTLLDSGGYGKKDNMFYCHACVQYTNTHDGEQRPKALVDAQLRTYSLTLGTMGECENPSCRQASSKTRAIEVANAGWLRLCGTCYQYARRHNVLRSREMVSSARKVHKSLGNPASSQCHNANCRSTELEGGLYYKDKLYCRKCGIYVRKHEGEERPSALVSSDSVRLDECENPNCDVVTALLSSVEVEGEGRFRLCRSCAAYTRRNKRLRSAEMVQRAQKSRKRREKNNPCHNPNCRTAELVGGGYAKCNGQFYCLACRQYADNHDGENRPKKLVDEQALRHSRYMWQLTHG